MGMQAQKDPAAQRCLAVPPRPPLLHPVDSPDQFSHPVGKMDPYSLRLDIPSRLPQRPSLSQKTSNGGLTMTGPGTAVNPWKTSHPHQTTSPALKDKEFFHQKEGQLGKTTAMDFNIPQHFKKVL